MRVALTGGDAFSVDPAGPQLKMIDWTNVTKWSWSVTPKISGHQVLILSLEAMLNVKGREAPFPIYQHRRPIEVEVDWPETMGEWFHFVWKTAENAHVLLFIVTGSAALAAWLVARLHSAKP